MKRRIVLFFLIVLSFSAGGCWDRQELSELAIILAAGLDRTPDGKIELTLQLARPAAFAGGAAAEGGGGRAPAPGTVWVVSATGETVFAAQHNLALQVSRRLRWPHCILVVFGEELARHGVRDVTNFLHRRPGPRETMWVMVAPGKAKKVLESHSELEKSSAQALGLLAQKKDGWSVNFKDFIRDLVSLGINPVASRVELKHQGEPQGPGMEKAPKHQEVVLTGAALFENDKLVGWLDARETSGLMWLRGKIKKGVVVVPVDPKGEKISFEIIRNTTRIKPEYDGGKIRFLVEIDTEGNLVEQQTLQDLSTPEALRQVEKKIAREIETRAKSALDLAQGKYGVDSFGFGDAFHRKYKKEWRKIKRRWNEVFADAEIYLSVEAHIRNTGIQLKRPYPKEHPLGKPLKK